MAGTLRDITTEDPEDFFRRQQDMATRFEEIRSYIRNQYSSIAPTTDLLRAWSRIQETREKQQLTKEEEREWDLLEQAYLNHLKWRFSYPQQVFSQQLISSRIITAMVVILVLAGLAFAGFQLWTALRQQNIGELSSSLALETAGRITITSSVVGAIVLVISLVFFYLYLHYVYALKDVTPPHVSLFETDATELLGHAPVRKQRKKTPARTTK